MRILILLCLSFQLIAQYDHISVFPDLEDQALFSALVDNYKPAFVADFSDAKDLLYKEVHLHDDSVRCVYSGLSLYLDLNEDPSQYLFGSGGNENINLEHSYPQGKGASSGNAQADMHHLFPTRVPVNSARANDPFKELPDSQTNNWYYKTETRNSPPPSAIRDLYSEDTGGGFEPREDFKGNIARAIFYFYTMYRTAADGADPDYFESQKATLCAWHELDPVDSLEWVRNYKIAAFQNDKVNPYILDCRLARLYCGEISSPCRATGVQNLPNNEALLFPSKLSSGAAVSLTDRLDLASINLTILDSSGKILRRFSPDSYHITFPYPPGHYFVLITTPVRTYSQKILITE